MAAAPPQDPRRLIPSVDRLLDEPAVSRLVGLYGRDLVRVQVQRALQELRELALDPAQPIGEALALLPGRLGAALGRETGGLRRVLNATGVLVHTNLGRSPLAPGVAAALGPLLDAGCDLEFDLASGRRGRRQKSVAGLLEAAVGAPASLVVNNNAAALLLACAALGAGREVVVSRGELVEIGGSFRIPDLLASAGARLVEVGTTNRTRLRDYAEAISPSTAILLKVLPSNYRISGFVAAVDAEALADLGRRRGVPLVVDEGSGLLAPHPAPQLRGHPSVRELLDAGADLVCSSGDKLLGGPQAGILCGRFELVSRLESHPLYRAVRPDRFQIAALGAVLRSRLRGEPQPLDRMWPEPGSHRERLERVVSELGREIGAERVEADAYLGGGAAPEQPIPGEALALAARRGLETRLRLGEPAVVGYVRADRLILDLRTVAVDDDAALIAAVRAAHLAPAEEA